MKFAIGSGGARMLLLLSALSPAPCIAQASGATPSTEQYPKPLVHTPTDHPAARVILIAVDGLHAFDLANWVATHPQSTLAELSARGDTYTNAHVPWADPAAALASLVTGGTPISTGIVSAEGYDRSLSPAGSRCQSVGTPMTLDAKEAPLDPRKGCSPVALHSLLRVNTMFEVVHEKIGPTAWAGASPGLTDLLRGPSGTGLDETCASRTPGSSVEVRLDEDAARFDALLHWIDAKDCNGIRDRPVPVLSGIAATSFAAAQSQLGYADVAGTLSPAMAQILGALDSQIGRVVAELKARKLYDSTWIFVVGPYGQAPIDPHRRRVIPLAQIGAAIDSVQRGAVAHVSGGDAATIWLRDPRSTRAVVAALEAKRSALGIAAIYAGERLALTLNRAESDPRSPDIVLAPATGVLWGTAGDHALASHGGFSDADTHVALLVSGVQFQHRSDPTWVPTTQLPPLVLRALGMEKFDLQALHLEHSPALPGIF